MPSLETRPGEGARFDIVSAYQALLRDDSDLTMPVAAIEALVQALAQTPSTTVSETLEHLSALTSDLKSGVKNSISLSAGTDLFQRYIITSLRPAAGLGSGDPASDFELVRAHLINNGRLFVERAKQARDKIAALGSHFIRDGHTVLTNGGSRVVGALLRSAAAGSGTNTGIRFKVIHVADDHDPDTQANISALRRLGVPVAAISPTAVAFSLSQVTAVFVGAEGVVENGGIISRLGTYQMGLLAKSAGKPFYVVSETHKFVRQYPLNQLDLPVEQNVVEFETEETNIETAKVPEQAVDYTVSCLCRFLPEPV